MALFATMASQKSEEFRLRSFRLRGERMTKAQAGAMDQHLSEFEIPLDNPIELEKIFPRDKYQEIVCEIGSGMGEASSQIAYENPDSAYLAVEVHKPGIGALLIRANNLGIKNLRVINEDIYLVLRDYIPDSSFDAFHIFFPDPWPKRRQHKRRLLSSEFIETLATKLKPGGRINVATDWQPYAKEIESNFANSKSFNGGVIQRPTWRPLTKFESKGLGKDHLVTDLQYFKN
jgi:tRNA (guanine-N7-)-methyltransferase